MCVVTRYRVRHALKIVLALAFLASPGSAISGPAAITIDDFSLSAPTAAATNLFSTSGPPSWSPLLSPVIQQSTSGTILGGQRDIYAGVVSGTPMSNSFGCVLTAGTFYVNTGAPGAVVVLQYDGNTEPEPGTTLNNAGGLGVNLIAGGNDAFRIAFDRLDVGETQSAMDYEIMLNGNASLVRGGAIAPSATPFSVTLPFSSFGANWPTLLSNVSSIDFRFNPSGARNVDYELTSLQAVPEPSALALLAVGVCGAVVMGCVRRRDVRKITT